MNHSQAETLRNPLYVDKTMMIAEINRFMDIGNKYICVSRPRRFGKTIASNMLCAYYSRGCDAGELFAPYRIASDPVFETKLNKYNVIKIDVNSEYQNARDKEKMLYRLEEEIKEEMRRTFPNVSIGEEDSLADSIRKIHGEENETFIILMDEYDVLVREQVPQALFDEYLRFLNGLFKSDTVRPAIALAYLTGILPVVRDKVQSKLNNFREYTILDAGELSEFVGFTAEEVHALCADNQMDFAECRSWYDGYRIKRPARKTDSNDPDFYEVYNPESVVRSMESCEFGSYWSATSTYEAIAERIRMNFEGTREDVVKMLAGESVDVNITRFLNTMTSFKTKDDVFTYLIHIGYLTYDADAKTCRIPNKEVRGEWMNAIETEPGYEVTNKIIKASKELLAETLNGNEEAVAKALDVSHIHVTSNRSYNNEDALQSAIYLAYIYAFNKYTVTKEMTAGKGRTRSGGSRFCADRSGSGDFADLTYIPLKSDRPAMIIELKRNGTAESAIHQIKEKRYFESLSHYAGDLLFVGINYDEKEKTHTCRIERFRKNGAGDGITENV